MQYAIRVETENDSFVVGVTAENEITAALKFTSLFEVKDDNAKIMPPRALKTVEVPMPSITPTFAHTLPKVPVTEEVRAARAKREAYARAVNGAEFYEDNAA